MPQDPSRYVIYAFSSLLVSSLDPLANHLKQPAPPLPPVKCSTDTCTNRGVGAISTFPVPFKGKAFLCDLHVEFTWGRSHFREKRVRLPLLLQDPVRRCRHHRKANSRGSRGGVSTSAFLGDTGEGLVQTNCSSLQIRQCSLPVTSCTKTW